MVGHLSPACSTSVLQECVLRTALPCNDNHYIFSVFCWCHRSGSRGQCFRATFDHLQIPINYHIAQIAFHCVENEKEKTHLRQEMCNSELKGEYLHFIAWQYAFCMHVFMKCSYLYSCRAR